LTTVELKFLAKLVHSKDKNYYLLNDS